MIAPRIVLCADDYAMTDDISQGIEALALARRLSAASAMVTTRHWPAHGARLAHLRGEYLNVGPFHYDPGNLEQESYALANFRAGISGRWWRLEAWVRNAFDESCIPVAFQPSPLDPSVFVGESGAPRTYGITLIVTP